MTNEHTNTAAASPLDAALAKAIHLANWAERHELQAATLAECFNRDIQSGAYDGATGIVVGKFRRHVTQAEVMREDSRPMRRAAKLAKASRQAATDAAVEYVKLAAAAAK